MQAPKTGEANQNVKVSVIIPVYNSEPYLRENLDCIVLQTLKEIEIICVNDGSTDGSVSILDEYAANDHRIKIIHQENRGQSAARNAGIDIASGEYLYFYDSDDRIDLNALDSLYQDCHENNLDMLHFDADTFYDDEQLSVAFPHFANQYKKKKEYGTFSTGIMLFAALKEDASYTCSPCCYLIKKYLFDIKKIRYYEGIIHEDELFTFKLFISAEKSKHVNHAYFHRRIRSDSVMTKEKTIKNVNGYITCSIQMYYEIIDKRFDDDRTNNIISKHIASFARSAMRIYQRLSDKEKISAMTSEQYKTLSLILNSLADEYYYKTEAKPNVLLFPTNAQKEKLLAEKDKNTPLVTVVIPVYNASAYLAECLDSVISQTLKNIDILCINDGSTDDSLAVLHSYAKKDNRIRIIDKPNEGHGPTVNVGLRNAKGRYIGFVDADDYLDKDAMETLFFMAEFNQLDFVKANMVNFTGTDGKRSFKPFPVLLDNDLYHTVIDPITQENAFLQQLHVVAGLYRRDFILDHQIFYGENGHASCQDILFWFKSMSSAHRMCFLDRDFYMYRRDSNTSLSSDAQKALDILDVYVQLKEIIEGMPDLKRKLMPIYQKTKYLRYRYASTKIAEEHQLALWQRFCEELKLSKEQGELDTRLFTEDEIEHINNIMEDPARYLFGRYLGDRHRKAVEELDRINNEVRLAQIKLLLAQKNGMPPRGKKKVAVIMPVYNAQKHLRISLDNILSQTLGDDLEVICVDDGSTDYSLEILMEYQASDPRLQVFSQENLGAGPARNKGLEAANAEFVAFMDADDFYPSVDVLETLYQLAKENDVRICGGRRIIKRSEAFEFPHENPKHEGIIPYSEYQHDYGYQCFLYDLVMLRSNNIIFPDYRRYQDPPFFVKAMITAGCFYATAKVVYCYQRSTLTFKWDEERVCDVLRGMIDELTLARDAHLDNLYHTVTTRFTELSKIIVNSLMNGSVETMRLLLEANDLVNEYLLPGIQVKGNMVTLDPLKIFFSETAKAYRFEQEEKVKLEKKLKKSQADYQAMRRKNAQTTEKLKKFSADLKATRRSFSFKLGRFLTFPLRKVLAFCRLVRKKGVLPAVKRIFGKKVD